jgi:predicted amidohydrolase YtcJ
METRLQALHMYTLGSAWFSSEEDDFGSFEVGKVADLAVLTDDYLTVPDDRLRRIRSMLTLQAGRPVHSEGEFSRVQIG